MLSHPDAIPALETLATVCGGLQRGERCLIVTDAGADTSIVGQAASVLAALGGEVTIVTSSPAELPGDDPPDAVGAAMLEADLILELTSIFVGSSKARRTACEGGARYLTVPGLTWTTLRRGGPFTADFHALGEAARLIANAFDRASESGTDLRGSFEGRRGRPLWGVADEPGGYAAPPDVEVGASPLEGSAEGVVVVDGSLLFLGPDQLPSPVSLRFEAGRLVDAGGADAWRLLDALDRSQDEERMKVLAEVSIGLNPFSRPGGSPLELEGIVGGAHVAVGNNVAYGGSNDARSHIDCVLLRAMLELDGEPVTPAR